MSFVAASSAKPIIPGFGWIEDALTPFAEPVLRVATGLILMPHGAQKLFGWFGGYGIDGTGQYFATQLHLPASLALLAGLIEFFGGLALAAGFATRAAAALVVGMISVAIVCVHLPNGFFWTSGGFEYPLLWGIVALYFVVRGGGRYSVDTAIGREI